MKHELSNRLEKEIRNFKKEITELETKCDEFIDFNDYSKYKNITEKINAHNAVLIEKLERSEMFEDQAKFMGYNQDEDPKKDPPTKEIQTLINEKFKP